MSSGGKCLGRRKPGILVCAPILLFGFVFSLRAQTPSVQRYKVEGGVSAPHVLHAPDPEYSDEARRVGNQGTCVLRLVVGADGRPRDIQVSRRLGTGLDQRR
jgi:outer membrane biosynthesis protein TonB